MSTLSAASAALLAEELLESITSTLVDNGGVTWFVHVEDVGVLSVVWFCVRLPLVCFASFYFFFPYFFFLFMFLFAIVVYDGRKSDLIGMDENLI